MRWDTGSGRMTTVATGHGAVRRIHFAPPPSPELQFNPLARAELVARVSVLFASGLFGVWELDSRSELRPVRWNLLGVKAQRGRRSTWSTTHGVLRIGRGYTLQSLSFRMGGIVAVMKSCGER
jgi:hypothetical protein